VTKRSPFAIPGEPVEPKPNPTADDALTELERELGVLDDALSDLAAELRQPLPPLPPRPPEPAKANAIQLACGVFALVMLLSFSGCVATCAATLTALDPDLAQPV